MTNEPISQEEIDALLRGMSLNQGDSPDVERWEPLRQAVEVAMKAAWTAAPALLGAPVVADRVDVAEETAEAAAEAAGGDVVWGRLPLGGSAVHILVPVPMARAFLALVLGGEVPGAGLDGAGAEALAEILSQLMNKGMQKLLEQTGMQEPLGGVSLAGGEPAAGTPLVIFRQSIRFEAESAGTMALGLPLDLAERMVAGAGRSETSAAAGAPARPAAPLPASAPAQAASPPSAPAAAFSPGSGAAPQQPPAPARPAPSAPPETPVSYRPAHFEDFGSPQPAGQTGESRNLDLLLDVSLQVTVELGRTRRQIRDVLSLAPGSVLELEKLAGEPVEVLVNGKLIARGEVVVIDEHFGVRITDIISPAERAASLGR